MNTTTTPTAQDNLRTENPAPWRICSNTGCPVLITHYESEHPECCMKPIQEPAPDYGEPWTLMSTGAVHDRNDNLVTEDSAKLRVLSCVNACAGMADPAAEIEAMRNELNALRWIPITERLPTIEDANEFEDVEWSDGKSIREGHYQNRKGETHWRRITLP